jgi:hypothetical protein
MKKRNVTVTLDEETARWVRVEAAREDTSVSAYLAALLRDRRERSTAYDRARDRFMERPPRSLRDPDCRLPTRDEVHER